MYKYSTVASFDRDIKRIKKRDHYTYLKVRRIIILLITNPFTKRLRTHKVRIRNYGEAWSTRVNGDVRIGWILNNNEIILIKVGTHDEMY